MHFCTKSELGSKVSFSVEMSLIILLSVTCGVLVQQVFSAYKAAVEVQIILMVKWLKIKIKELNFMGEAKELQFFCAVQVRNAFFIILFSISLRYF